MRVVGVFATELPRRFVWRQGSLEAIGGLLLVPLRAWNLFIAPSCGPPTQALPTRKPPCFATSRIVPRPARRAPYHAKRIDILEDKTRVFPRGEAPMTAWLSPGGAIGEVRRHDSGTASIMSPGSAHSFCFRAAGFNPREPSARRVEWRATASETQRSCPPLPMRLGTILIALPRPLPIIMLGSSSSCITGRAWRSGRVPLAP